MQEELESSTDNNLNVSTGKDKTHQIEAALQKVLTDSQNDRPVWEDLQTFWQRCQDLVVVIAQIYNPEVKYPLLNIYILQVYGLICGTVHDMDKYMQKL